MSKKQSHLLNNFTLPELLVPAGGREQFEAALIYGADAVYVGGQDLNLRIASEGFSDTELRQAVLDAHKVNVKIYYCLNALPYDYQLEAVQKRLEILADANEHERVDALIIADAGVLSLAQKICPDIEIHLSTQAHTVNRASAAFWRDQGVSRVNLARELDYKSIASIKNALPDFEFEVFVHGAMCLALSGHCLLSMWANKRAANLGHCSQPCRFEYKGKELSLHEAKLTVSEKKREDEVFWEAEENEEFSTIWAPHELCLIRYLSWFVQQGITALKIEGRTKSPSYVAQVTDIYRTALNRTIQENKSADGLSNALLIKELARTATRQLSTGFFLSKERHIEAEPLKGQGKVLARLVEQVKSYAWAVDVRDTWKTDADIEVLVPGLKRPQMLSSSYVLENHKGEKVDTLHPGMKGVLYLNSAEADYFKPLLYIRQSL